MIAALPVLSAEYDYSVTFRKALAQIIERLGVVQVDGPAFHYDTDGRPYTSFHYCGAKPEGEDLVWISSLAKLLDATESILRTFVNNKKTLVWRTRPEFYQATAKDVYCNEFPIFAIYFRCSAR